MAIIVPQDFLDTEIYQEMYDVIINFLSSFEIREGKFEANEYLIHKLNRETVILYKEYETPKGWEYSHDAKIFNIDFLVNVINSFAKSKGLIMDNKDD